MAHARSTSLFVALITLVTLACGPEPKPPAVAPPAPVPAPAAITAPTPSASNALRFTVSFPASLSATPLDGRVLVILAKGGSAAPRTQVSDRDDTAQIFGVDVEGLAPGASATIGGDVLGYPVASLGAIAAGDYVVEAVLHRYETFVRGDGHTVKLPADRGEGQNWTEAPGNLVSAPRTIHVDPSAGGEQHLDLASALPPVPAMVDTRYVKHVSFKSERLTKFWGRDTYLGAVVLLPEGWDTHPNAHYPVVINHGHFEREPSWREKPADASLPPVDLPNLRAHCPNGHEGAQCTKYGYPRFTQETQYASFQKWTGKGFPRFLGVIVQHANPYYDDSYAVNSANVGPYGDAITYEFLPYLEKTYRGLGPWARGVMGGSTGGWESLAVQVLYPQEYNGIVAACPDPIDFHSYMTVDLYADTNAYFAEGPFRRTPRPAERDYLGATRSTMEQQNLHELVVGTHARSGGQWDIWQAVFSPVGSDGYPEPIWDKRTGVIDPHVAAYWKEHYDLEHILERDWTRLQPLLKGKITIDVGLSDNFFLNDAVYRMDDFLRKASPPADAHVDYGPRDEHCWSGDHTEVNAVTRLTYFERLVPPLVAHWLKTAPRGADLKSWRY